MNLVQLSGSGAQRCVAMVEDDATLRILNGFTSTYAIAWLAIQRETSIDEVAAENAGGETLPYQEVCEGESEWRLDVPFHHPEDPAHCLVSGTGLTHKASAENRSRMHDAQAAAMTDSIRMYQWGLEGGSPPWGRVGVQPEWFYKGDGSILRAHGQELTVPSYGGDGGEEPEVAGVYVIGPEGEVFRVGLTTGNEFSDHRMERQNYLYLAPSKLRQCAVGPELATDIRFDHLEGSVALERNGNVYWSTPIFTGEKNMSHTLANLEHHHFKYEQHRRPGDVHIHFFGADAFSFGEGVELADGDEMVVSWFGLGRPLRNRVRVEQKPEVFVRVHALSKT